MIDKLAIAVISPLGSSLLLGVCALAMALLGRRRLGSWLGLVALLWLWLWATPVVSQWARGRLEQAYPPLAVASLPTAQAIVVLGGGMSSPTPRRPYADLSAASDRVWHAARLWHAGKAPLLLLSGGAAGGPGAISEAEAMRLFLRDLGVPDRAVLLEERSGNSRENAAMSAALLKQRAPSAAPDAAQPGKPMRVLLVTSALHMARARAHFEAAGLDVVPAATDHESLGPEDPLRLLPSAEALDGSGRALKEWVGQLLWARQ